MPTTVDTTTTNQALHPDGFAKTANGVKWLAYDNGSNIELSYNDGGGWTSHGTVGSNGQEASLFIDEDDYAHLAFIQSSAVHYWRGTPTDGTRTDWTWDGPYTHTGQDTEHSPRVVAHSEGTGWKAHIIFGAKDADSWSNGTWWYRRKCGHGSAGGHTHAQTCGGWTTGTPAGCIGFGTHSHYGSDLFCGPTCEAWPNNGSARNCVALQLTPHTHSPIDNGTDSYYEVTSSGTDYYNRVYYVRLDITAAHVITTEQASQQLDIQGDYNESHPFIDFAHTGDGKTPKASPHVFVGWQNRSGETYYLQLTYAGGWSSWSSKVLCKSGEYAGYAVGGYNGSDMVIFHRDQSSSVRLLGWHVSDAQVATQYPTIPDLPYNLKCVGVALDGDIVYLFAADVTQKDLLVMVYDGSWAADWETVEVADIEDPYFPNQIVVERHATASVVGITFLEGSASPWDLDFVEYGVSVVGGGGFGFIPIGG